MSDYDLPVPALSDYEKKQIKNILTWSSEEPSVFAKASGFLSKPFEFLVKRLIPKSLMKSVIDGANSAAEFLSDEDDICRDGKVSKIEELQTKNLSLSDELANEVHNWAIGIATAEGGVAGATGVVGIAVDIPALLTLSLRTIHKIGLCYGYKANTLEEKDFVLRILSAASSNNPKEKSLALLELKALETTIHKQAWKVIDDIAEKNPLSHEFIASLIKDLCKQLNINLTKRKAMQAIPVVGATIGVAVNADFVRDVGWAARRIYQKRWLEDNNKWQE